jgi:HEPN domain-containing protein
MKSKLVKQWFKYAATDLKVAKNSLIFSAEFKAISAFHSQQCAEKAIKGYLLHHKVRFPKSHDIGTLIDLVENIDAELSKKIRKSEVLTEYAVSYRYPEETERSQMTAAKAKSAIKLAEMVLEACKV